jgi:hypothetical protein
MGYLLGKYTIKGAYKSIYNFFYLYFNKKKEKLC